MNNEAPEAFDQMLDNLPVGQAPVDGLLRAGHAAKRRRRRACVVGAAAVTALVLGGVAVGSNALIPDEQQQPPAAGTSVQSTPVDLPTNGWKPGDISMAALIFGTLGLDENNCVVLLGPPGSGARNHVAWPAGYSATINPDGLHLFDAEGTEVARSGDQIEMGGGFVPAPAGSHPCLPQGHGDIASVQSKVTVTSTSRLGEVDLPCPAEQRTTTDIDYPGPGQPTPEKAVGPLLGELSVGAVNEEGRQATLSAIGDDGVVKRVYSLTRHADGWWPDGYTTCSP